MNLLYILVAILLLGILVVIHEAGHFWAARMTGIDVTEFAVGLGPKLLSWRSRKHDTQFSVRAIPLGGFCAFRGDESDGENKDDPRAFHKQAVWKRIITVLMGPLMNFVLAFLVLVGYFCLNGVAVVDPVLISIEQAGPAEAAGLLAGDRILEINGTDLRDAAPSDASALIAAYRAGDAPLHIVVQRGEDAKAMDVTPFWDEKDGRFRIGIMLGGALRTRIAADGSEQLALRRMGLPEAIVNGWAQCVHAGSLILDALKDLVTTGKGLDQTSGPVGVVTIVSEEVRTGGLDAFLNLLVVISINLGIMNLLPFPGLDGSRALFMVVEILRGKPVAPEKEAVVHLIGMLLLFLLMIFFTFNDVMRLFGR